MVRRWWQAIVFLFFVLPICSAYGATYSGGYSASRALVIGIDRYLTWPHLEYAAADAEQMAWMLKKAGFEVTLMLDGQATKKRIVEKLTQLLRQSDRDSRLFVYFAGHGQTEDRPGGGEKGYIVPVDADLYNWQETMLPFGLIREKIHKAQAKHIFLAFDSCYSGLGVTRGISVQRSRDAGYIGKMMRLRAVQVLTAGGRSEQAIEQDGHGLFTASLLNALEGRADINRDGYSTGTEIYAFLRPLVTSRSYNRQTPQFGYIEGEGDMIFQLPEKASAKQSRLTISNEVAGIDLWINGERIASGLAAGRYHYPVRAGRVVVLVKKGPYTLYNQARLAKAGAEITVSVDRTAKGSGHQPFAMYTIANRDIDNFSQSIAHDFDRDGAEELVTVSGSALYLFNRDGSVHWKRDFGFKLRLDLVEDYNGRGVIGISGRDDDIVRLLLVDGSGGIVWKKDRRVTARYRNKIDGSGRIAALADLDGDGRKEILAFATTGYSWKPRGLIVYEQSGKERWRYPIGGSPQNLVVWQKDGGNPDIILSSYSPGNGNRESSNHTDDHHSYVMSVDSRGRTNWVQQLGATFSGNWLLLADLDGDGDKELYARKWAAYNYRQDAGGIYRFDRTGRISARLNTGRSIKSFIASGPVPGERYLWAADKDGDVYKCDGNLHVLARHNLNRSAIPLNIQLVGVHDYDGDGRGDLLLSSYNRLQKGRNPRSDYGPKNKVFYSNMSYLVLSGDLQKTIKQVSIAEEWEKWRGFKVISVKRPEMRQYPFIALSDKVTFFNF